MMFVLVPLLFCGSCLIMAVLPSSPVAGIPVLTILPQLSFHDCVIIHVATVGDCPVTAVLC